MASTNHHLKAATFNFRIDPALKAAFARATETEHKPAAQVLRELIRNYVDRRSHESFEAETRRQSREAAARACDPASDEAQSLLEMEAHFDEDHFSEECKG